jgi:DNA-binding NarL/FixJ family response regulator
MGEAGERTLTDRQVAIIRLIADGKRDPEIAELLEITEDAAKQHVYRILNSTGKNTRGGLVAWALREGIIQ